MSLEPGEIKEGIERISLKHMFQVVLSIWNLEKGLLFTLREMISDPGGSLRTYLFKDRSRFVHPLRFLFFSAALAAFINTQFIFPADEIKEQMEVGIKVGQEQNADEGEVTESETDPALTGSNEVVASDSIEVNAPSFKEGKKKISKQEVASLLSSFFIDFYTRYQNLLLLILVPIQAFFTWLFFRKNKFFFGEHLAINAFIASVLNVVYLIIAPLTKIDGMELLMVALMIGGFAYSIVAFVQVFRRTTFGGVVRAVLAYFFGFFSYLFFVMALVIFMMNRYIESQGL